MTMPDYETMPKVELHLHLEGAVPIDALWTLVEARGEASGIGSIDELRSRFTFRDFAHFIDTWVWQNQFLDTYETFTFVAEAVASPVRTSSRARSTSRHPTSEGTVWTPQSWRHRFGRV